MSIQPGVGYTFTSSSLGTNMNIEQPWSEWSSSSVCPFTIYSKKVGEEYHFRCTPGMVNSIIPQIGIEPDPAMRLDQIPTPTTEWNFDDTTHYSYVYLKVSADYSSPPTLFPVTDEEDILYPRIISSSVEQYATDDSVFFLLATAYQDPETNAITIWQVTCGSQWCDRVKLGTDTARYYFARV